ncbi:MAG: GGDEF domain-containing protein [Actinobacteria bacterium]|nr:GGDEF domain-containing protein [Actinomycetota bacterium]
MVHTSPWDLAIESVEEALRSGAVPSLDGLGRLGQLGNLPALVAALRDERDAALVALAHAREREGLGFSLRDVAAELLALGRVLERRGERAARDRLDWCVLLYFEHVTDELVDRARRDPLTGLLNHQAFHAALAREAARACRYRGRVALVLFDLDNFKETNDTQGHQEGDRLLRAFSAVLADTVRENDCLGRLGGDEFATLLVQADAGSVDAFLGRLTARLPGKLSVSSGAAYLSEASGPHEQLFELADRRLYASKMARAA